MSTPKKPISNRILNTELSVAMQYIDNMDFGSAKKLIGQVLARVDSYDLTTWPTCKGCKHECHVSICNCLKCKRRDGQSDYFVKK